MDENEKQERADNTTPQQFAEAVERILNETFVLYSIASRLRTERKQEFMKFILDGNSVDTETLLANVVTYMTSLLTELAFGFKMVEAIVPKT